MSSHYTTVGIIHSDKSPCPREESNFHFVLRTDLFYPLNYGGDSVTL